MAAVDSSVYTKWLCAPFVPYASGDAGCDDTCVAASDGMCADGGPGSEYSWYDACEYGTDCSDCGPRGEGGAGATLTVEFQGHHSIHSYKLTTADDFPERDPTNWTLECVDRVGNVTVVDVVDGAVPPTERHTDYETFSLFPLPPSPPPMPPKEPLPPITPPPTAPPPSVPCHDVTVSTVTTTWGTEQTWIIDGSKMIESGALSSGTSLSPLTTTTTACLGPGPHTIALYDSFGDGWSPGSYVTIEDVATRTEIRPQVSATGGGPEAYGFWVGPTPMTPRCKKDSKLF